jgi:hypothetical protein
MIPRWRIYQSIDFHVSDMAWKWLFADGPPPIFRDERDRNPRMVKS